MRVFLSYSTVDRPAVEQLAESLRAYGIEPGFDQWEVTGGDDIVVRMNDGLEKAEGAIVVFSAHSSESR
jgi:hypothetical protein